MKKLIILVVVLIVVVLVFLAYYRLPDYLLGPGMVLDFKDVNSFSRKDQFVASFPGHNLMKLDILGKSVQAPMTLVLNEGAKPTTVHPTGKSYYKCSEKEILKYESSGHVISKIGLEMLNLSPEDHKFNYVINVSEDTLWVAVKRISGKIPDLGITYSWDTVVEVSIGQSQVTGITHVVGDYICAAIDVSNNKGFFVDSEVRVYDFAKNIFIQSIKLPHYFSSAQYDEKHGLLLSSNRWRKDSVVLLFKPDTGKISEIAKGIDAQWGFEEYIYFERGYGQLWRCKPDGSETEPVYLHTKSTRASKAFLSSPRFGRDRSFLAVGSNVPMLMGGWREGLILFDLKEKEYRVIPKGTYK